MRNSYRKDTGSTSTSTRTRVRFHLRQPGAQQWLHGHVPPGFQQQPPPVASAQDRQRRRRRTQHHDAIPLRRGPPQVTGRRIRRRAVIRTHDQGGQAAIGRPMTRAALSALLRHEGGEVTGHQGLHDRVLGAEGLQQHLAGCLRPPGAARHLVQQLHGALCRAQIAACQAEIGVHHPH